MQSVEYKLLTDALLLRAYSSASVSSEELHLMLRAANYKFIEILKNINGSNIGYIVWGSVNKYSVLNLMNNGVLPKYSYESGEGNICLILSVFIAPGYSTEAIRKIKSFVKNRRMIVYLNKGRAIYWIRKKNKFYSKKIKSHSAAIPAVSKAVA